MKNEDLLGKSGRAVRWKEAEERLKDMFQEAGWRVKSVPRASAFEADLLIRRPGLAYVIELKAGSEGRSDRLIPLFAQAALQVMRSASNAQPLAIVAAPRVPRRAAEQVLDFAAQYAPDVAVGVFDLEGLRLFRGPGLENLNAEAARPSASLASAARESRNLFSDLNQWMLKVLLAPEVPERLLSAPRGRYPNASELAKAARVSAMSGFRFVQQLQEEGYLHESSPSLALVRRQDLFARWQAWGDRPIKELPMRFVLPGNPRDQLRKVLGSGQACFALFAAAEALQLGFVEGVPPYVYVESLQPSRLAQWKNLRPCEPGESPDVMLRQAPVPQAIFRGMVEAGDGAASDVLQVWVDVVWHPARGREQADLIRQRVLEPLIRKAD
jgi:hypothetical protein